MKVSDIDGLKYPNEYFIKYFFKRGFDKGDKKKFIEFGSSNGNNLMLPYQYGHEVIGVDFDVTLIEYANSNFEKLNQDNSYHFYADDMKNYVHKSKNLNVDVFLLPNIVNYLTTDEFVNFLDSVVESGMIKKGADFFIRARSIKDFRFGKGEKIGKNSYRLDDDVTGENGAICTCYQEYELVDLCRQHLNLRDFKLFSVDVQNLHSGINVLNSDIVIWGTIG